MPENRLGQHPDDVSHLLALDVDDGCEALGVGGPETASEGVHGINAGSNNDCELKVFGPAPAIAATALTEDVMGIPGGERTTPVEPYSFR